MNLVGALQNDPREVGQEPDLVTLVGRGANFGDLRPVKEGEAIVAAGDRWPQDRVEQVGFGAEAAVDGLGRRRRHAPRWPP